MSSSLRNVRALALALGALLVAGCTYALVSGNSVNQSRAERVVAGIQEIRELNFKHPVPIVVETRDQAEKSMEADLERDFTDAQLHADGVAGSMLGLFPRGFDLKSESLKLAKSQVAGYYDPHRKQMALVEGTVDIGFWDKAAEFLVQRDLVGEMLLAHELTHALQDQNFGLEQMLDNVKNDDDRGTALKSVAEGDATIAGLAYVLGQMNQATLDRILAGSAQLPQLFATQTASIPEGLSEPLIFQYDQGMRFVAEAYRRGGWDAVDRLYRDPPLSSQQIIDPRMYFDHRVDPLDVSLEGYQPMLKDWRVVDEDTYGELLLSLILKINLGKDAPAVALAKKWSGDHMVILSHGEEIAVLWLIAFEGEDSASAFAAAYRGILSGQPGPSQVEARKSAVLVVAGAPARDFAALAPLIWKSSSIAPLHHEI